MEHLTGPIIYMERDVMSLVYKLQDVVPAQN